MPDRKPILPSSAVWFYPLRQLRHRPVTVLSGAAVLFCLLSMLTLSLILSESGHIAAVTESGTGTHYGVVYRLNREQYLAFLELRDTWEGEFLTVPVYARMEDVETEEGILSLAVLSEETADWYAIDTAPGTWEILLPSRIVESDSYYIPGTERSCFFHGQNSRGEKAGDAITRSLTVTETGSCNDQNLPYAFVTQDMAKEILSAAGGEITYDLYFTTTHPSDLAVAQVIDRLHSQLHLRPGIEGDPFFQTLHPGQTRRIIYRDYINYPLLDLLNREYMDDPSFFFLLLPTILAASFAMAGHLRDNLEDHPGEYGILKASGCGKKTLYGSLYASALLLVLLALPPVLLSVSGIAGMYMDAVNRTLAEQGIRYRFGLPVGNLVTVCLYVLVFTCVLLYLLTRRLLSAHPSALLRRVPVENIPDVQMSAWQALNRRDPVGYMVNVQFRRERKRRLYHAFTDSLLMGVCGYMVVTLTVRTGGMIELLYGLYLYGAWLLLMILAAFGEVRQQKRELAILRQCGTTDSTIRRKLRRIQLCTTLSGMGITVGLFAFLFALPYLLPGWVFNSTPMIEFLLSDAYQFPLLLSGAVALVLETGNLFLGQLVMLIPVQRMLRRGILADLQGTE
ncbi:MAG: hypothetical protein IJB52_13240 [Clostridia bacterium]|nr:hypothetical protein [Clostridia bacterium]